MPWQSPQITRIRSSLVAAISPHLGSRLRVGIASTVAVAMLVFGLVLINAVVGNVASAYRDSVPINVLANGNFEDGFAAQPSCGDVGSGWHCFTNGGAVHYGFSDGPAPTNVAEGSHSQTLKMATWGLSGPDHDRYAGIYQTVRVVDWAEYTLAMKGLIRTTVHSGDPWRYRVEVGWTPGYTADWTKVTNWADAGWDTYYDTGAAGSFSSYSTKFIAEDDYITVYIRAWKKWGVPEEEISISLDAISLTGPGMGYPIPTSTATPMPTSDVVILPTSTPTSIPTSIPTAVPGPVTETKCEAANLVHNGDFENGFAKLTYGDVGTSWGHFVNGGRAAYGFYDEQWPPVIASGSHGQLIEINTKGLAAADGDRYAGIYQTITGLTKGATYQLSLKGMVRGTGGGPDDYRFEAQWGWNAGNNADWSQATWTSMDLGAIQDRTDPGDMGSYTVRFTAPDTTMTLFLRSWMKWGYTEAEVDVNFDAVSLQGCTTTTTHPAPPIHPVPCTYTVKPGDYLGKIAGNYGITVASLAGANGIWNYNHIYVGQVLAIPGCTTGGTVVRPPAPHPAPPPVVHRTHTVQPGEYLGGIAAWYGVNMYDLARANGISNLNHVWVGQVLVIP